MMEQFEFVPPPEAPVFEPSEEEFQDPLAFIEKIRPYAEKCGICKIRPPPDWNPPFAVDVETFRFTPRLQRLNELEARTRVKLNFLDNLAKFWELQGTQLKIPILERKSVDLYRLHKIVQEEGGFEFVSRKKKWSQVARKLDYIPGRSAPTMLRLHYEKLLYPYDIFLSGVMTGGEPQTVFSNKKDEKDKDYVPSGMGGKDVTRRSKRKVEDNEEGGQIKPVVIDYNSNPELKKLKFLAPGPKMQSAIVPNKNASGEGAVMEVVKSEEKPLPEIVIKEEKPVKAEKPSKSYGSTSSGDSKLNLSKEPELTRRRPVRQAARKPINDEIILPDWIEDDYICCVCSRGDNEDNLLLCDGCDGSYHTFCLIPPLNVIPKGDWRCPKCIAEECNKPQEAYGFEQAKKEYTLQSFGEMADDFKKGYFKMDAMHVPLEVVEKEFWRLTQSMDDEVVVEYGADLLTADVGSGFPLRTRPHFPEDEFYCDSPWNLNNIPVLEKSVLKHITANISGVKVPWIYIGMCFSSFCWHNEDHWSYSINYMHWGEPKTWYGIPGDCAVDFEKAMKEAAPELFEEQPDLLHQLVTIINPNILSAKGVPVVRTNQYPGEFVVTFPRAYHAGFNQGYNCAEAVNFATADWLPVGDNCIEHYRHMGRCPVFSHEELVCKMAAYPDTLDLTLAKAVYKNMKQMVDRETTDRKMLEEKGVTNMEREAFELLPDDERQCTSCKTTCFLSAITCSCCPDKMSCSRCYQEMCSCESSKLCLRYRYTLEELPAMLLRLKERADSFDNWAKEIKNALEANADNKVDVSELKGLVSTAEQSQFPECDLFQKLKAAVSEAEKCANVAVQLVSRKHRASRNVNNNQGSSSTPSIPRLTLEELQGFMQQVQNLPCIIQEAELVQDLMSRVESFQFEAQKVLQEPTPDPVKLQELIGTGIGLDVDLPEVPKLKLELRQAKWLEQVNTMLAEKQLVPLSTLHSLLDSAKVLSQKPAVEKAMSELKELVTVSERWEEKAKLCLQARPRHVMTTIEVIVEGASNVPVYLPNVSALKEALRKSREWSGKVDQVQNDVDYPYVEVLEALVMRGRPIPVRLDQLPQMESQVAAARAWRDRTTRTFLKKNSSATLLEVLSSRKDIGVYKAYGKSRKRKEREKEKEKEKEKESVLDLSALDEYIGRHPSLQIAAFKEAEKVELESMTNLRLENTTKQEESKAGGSSTDGQYCVCRRGVEGFMLQCELCRDWFHGTCVPLPRTQNGKTMGKGSAAAEAAKEIKYLCPMCCRSRRPRLETILSLLVSLQKLPVRLPEGEALQFLTERAMNWQDRARQFLAIDKIKDTLLTLELLDKENLPGTDDPVPNPPTPSSSQDNPLSVAQATCAQSTLDDASNVDIEVTDEGRQPIAGISVCPSPQKRPEVPSLTEAERAHLERLLMEGDLLEVTLDEVDQLWRVLQSQRAKEEELHPPDARLIDKEKKKRKRKKKDEVPTKLVKPTAAGTAEKGSEVVKKKRRKKEEKGVRHGKDGSKNPDDDDDEEDEVCSAKKCLRPADQEVGWVQCDTCEGWFHVYCVGISPQVAEAIESYQCPSCVPLSGGTTDCDTPNTGANSPESINVDVDSITPQATSPTSPHPPPLSHSFLVSTQSTAPVSASTAHVQQLKHADSPKGSRGSPDLECRESIPNL